MVILEFVTEKGQLSSLEFVNDMNRPPAPLGPGRPPHDGFEAIPRPTFHPPMGMEMGMMPGPQTPVMMVPGQPRPPFPGSPIFRPPDGHPLPPLPPPVPPHLVAHIPHPHGPPIPPPPHPLAASHPIPPPPPTHTPHPPLPLPPQHPHMSNTLMPPGTQFHPPLPNDAKLHPPLPPDPKVSKPDLNPPPPLPSNTLAVQPPLPPLPPLPPPMDTSKPPPPKEPPPPSPVKKPPLPSPSLPPPPPPSGSGVQDHQKPEEKKNLVKPSGGTPIPSIISSLPPVKLAHQQPTNGTASFHSSACHTNQTPTPPPLPLPLPPSSNVHSAFTHVPNANASGAAMEEEPYDPEEAMFSPSSSTESSPVEESQEDTLINKYVRNPKPGRSSENFTSSLKTPDRVRTDSKKKRVSFSNEVSFSSENKVPQESPARPNLDARLKIMFGTGPSAGDPSSPKVKKPLNKLPLPLDKPEKMDDLDDIDQPLPSTPSPFISRRMYLYWHRETVKLRKASKLSNLDFVDSNAKTQFKLDGNLGKTNAKNQMNGQLLTPNIPPLRAIPPLPKNLPTVPPPNYRKSLSEPVVFKDSSLKADSSLKNVGRVHPYKTNLNKKSNTIKANPLDSEFELACEATPLDILHEIDSTDNKGEHSILNHSKEKTVGLVLKRVLDDLRKAIRYELTKEILDKKVSKCLKSK